ncbi:tRNA (guanosine(46)-N7)-methyltransferase TrmB [Nitrogeniibacter mangrovi]|uniref:tRNA (guanine-N(7)-)-methyltransferase n=1 Tax=Nitrogeniibacter mangrovi TaxID=2016596 RepID=A0A6C1AYK4_9RHOO|nr:tRNA (guanosine(46)-N7)-methyltransferase TrmB [Nitrogeniibacter mangrovi]QID16436.1 tRNA (guanosine(46)-N7)-methyltransferase TrmB [Nitrogeniibacter mangrovi]
MTDHAKPDPATEAAPRLSRRPIRSFVLRQGRMSDAQTRFLEAKMPEVGISYAQAPVDLNAVFGRTAPKVVEIGFGMGDATAKIAQHLPDTDFVGIEVHSPGVGNLCKLIELEDIGNIRIIQHDAMEVMEDMIAPDSLDGVHVFFPDPWPKKRHHKRRLIQPAFVALLASRLKPGGYLHCATDWEEYAEQMLAVLAGEASLANTAKDYAPRPEYRPLTRFEARGLRLGHGVWDLVFRRR